MAGLNLEGTAFVDTYSDRILDHLKDDLPTDSFYSQRNLTLNVLTIALTKFAMDNLPEDYWDKFLKLTISQIEGTLDDNRKSKR